MMKAERTQEITFHVNKRLLIEKPNNTMLPRFHRNEGDSGGGKRDRMLVTGYS